MGTSEQEEARRQLIRRQKGAITRDQLRRLCVSDKQIHAMTKKGILMRVHPCTFVAPEVPFSWQGRVMAALLSLGDQWVGGMRSAARMHQMDGAESGLVEVIGAGCPKMRRGVIVHQTSWLPRSHRTRVDGIAVTTPTRTLLDLGAVCSLHAVEVALESALRSGLTSVGYLERHLAEFRGKGRRGSRAIDEILKIRAGLNTTDSALETLLFQVLRKGGLPLPRRQFPVYKDGVFVARPDFLYPNSKVAIEAHSLKHHFGLVAFENDPARRNRLIEAGYTVLEITHKQLKEEPRLVVAQVAGVLGMRLF